MKMYLIQSANINGKVMQVKEFTDAPEEIRLKLIEQYDVEEKDILFKFIKLKGKPKLEHVIASYYGIDTIFQRTRKIEYVIARLAFIYLNIVLLKKVRFHLSKEYKDEYGFEPASIRHALITIRDLKSNKCKGKYANVRPDISKMLNFLKQFYHEWKE